jgi:hypothetical protein
MAQHLVGEMRAAAYLVQKFFCFVELTQLAVNLWHLKVDLFVWVFLKQSQKPLQIFGESFVVLEE